MANFELVDASNSIVFTDTDALTMESSDLEDNVTSRSDMDINEEKEYNSDSSNTMNDKPQVKTGPVLSLQCLHDDDDDTNEPVQPVKIIAVNGSSSSSDSQNFQPQSSVPARNNWDGIHNFKIKFQINEIPKKSEHMIFSESKQKLYVIKDQPFKVLVYAENAPEGSIISVTAVYALAEHGFEVVQRCPTHEQADFSKGNPAYEHFVQCVSEGLAVYKKSPKTKKLSVSVPYEKPQEGENHTSYLFKLTCFNSCSGGINRRPFMLIFSLEKDNIPLGRQAIEAKVCACPLRDFKLEENKQRRKKVKSESTIISSSEDGTVNSKYTITVKDPELYLFLKQMKCLYEMSAYSSKTKPDA